MMVRRRVVLAAAIAVVAAALNAPAQVASATAFQCEPATDSYNCLIAESYPLGWRNAASLTYCFATTNRTHRYADGSRRAAFPLPVNYRKYVQAAAKTWAARPGLRVGLVEAACGPTTDIEVRGYRGATAEAGEGGCTGDNDRKSKYYRHCLPRSGRLLLSVDVPDDDQHAVALEHTALHEFGHILGLDHPCDHLCDGPIMSYKTCASTRECPVYPNYDDVAGLQIVYGWSASGDCSTAVGGLDGGALDPLWWEMTNLPDVASVPGFLDAPEYSVLPQARIRPRVPVAGNVVAGATEMVRRLADPSIDAAATLATTGGVLSNELDWVLIQGRLDHVVPNPARCLGM